MAKSSPLNVEAFVTFKPSLNGIKLQARQAKGRISSFSHKAREVNRAAVMEMAKAAADYIDSPESPTVRSANMRTGRLKAAVENPSSHRATIDGFVFLEHDAMYGQVIYWRLIEKGTHQFVGQQRRFIFLSGRNGRRVQPNPARRGTDTVSVGAELLSMMSGATARPRGQRAGEGLPLIRIKTPIEPHLYAQHAIERFAAGGYARYKELAQLAAADAGLELVIH